jgi:hypothetical protein
MQTERRIERRSQLDFRKAHRVALEFAPRPVLEHFTCDLVDRTKGRRIDGAQSLEIALGVATLGEEHIVAERIRKLPPATAGTRRLPRHGIEPVGGRIARLDERTQPRTAIRTPAQRSALRRRGARPRRRSHRRARRKHPQRLTAREPRSTMLHLPPSGALHGFRGTRRVRPVL